MKNWLYLVNMLVISFGISAQDPTRTTLHLVGDSTMADKPNLAYPERGWGQLLPAFMSPELVINNHASNGRSTRRFIDEGRWGVVLSELKKGDYVLVQFGHNDQKKTDPKRYASVEKDYPEFLKRYINEIRSKGATPLIASSICRRHFTKEGVLQRKLIDYAQAAKKVAQTSNVTFFDLNQQTCQFLTQIGEPKSQQYFIQVPEDLYTRYPDGKVDNTHLNVIGAAKVAQFFVRDLIEKQHALKEYVYRDAL